MIINRIPFLWCYARGNVMVNHRFSDDVALCLALNKKSARKKFDQLYKGIRENEISPVCFNKFGISILTDY